MALINIIFTIVITLASLFAFTTSAHVAAKEIASTDGTLMTQQKTSRFLAQTINLRNPNAADHCHKDGEICINEEGTNSTCCNNKCVDLAFDNKNCGACKNKCKFTQSCCRGECVYLSFDKRHCGHCNNRCEHGNYCVYGMCNYA